MPEEKQELTIAEQVEAAVAKAVEKQKAVISGAAGTGASPTTRSSSIHHDAPLSDFALKVIQDDEVFKAAKIVSNLNSSKRQDLYYFYEPAYFMINQVAARAEGAEAAMAKYGVSKRPYNTTVYGLKDPVTDEQVANSDEALGDLYEEAAGFITRQFLLNKEKKFASELLGTSIWGTDYTGQSAANAGSVPVLSGAFQQFDQSTSQPLDILEEACNAVHLKSGFRPNTAVMTRTVFSALKRNTSIKTLKLYTDSNSSTSEATLDTIAQHLGMPAENIFVMDVVEPATAHTISGTTFEITTDNEGYATNAAGDTTLNNQFIGGKGVLLMYVDKASNGRRSPTAAVCAQWTGLYPEGGKLGNTKFFRYREDSIHSEMIEGATAFSYHVVAPALGIYLDGAIA